MDVLAESDGNSKEKSISLASKDTNAQLGRPYIETKVLLQQQKSIEGCFECGQDVTRKMSLVLENSRSLDSLTESFGRGNTLLGDETENHVVAGQLEMEAYIQEKLNQSVSTWNRVVTDDKFCPLGKIESIDFSPNRNEVCGNKRGLPSNGNDKLVSSCCLETEMPLLQKQTPYIQSFSEVVPDDLVLVPKISEVVFPKVDADSVCKGTNLSSDDREEGRHIVRSSREVVPSDASPFAESHGTLSDKPTLHGYSANNNSSLNETLEHVSTAYEDTVMPPQAEHYRSCSGDTSPALEYTTLDICSGDGSENKNCDQKDDEVLYSVTDDHVSITNTSTSDGSRSCVRADAQKVVLLNEEQCQNFQTMPELALEISNSVDSFADSVEGCGSKSDASAGWTSYQQVTDALGTNSESRTSFVKYSTCPGSENVEAYAEEPILQHDPGEAATPL